MIAEGRNVVRHSPGQSGIAHDSRRSMMTAWRRHVRTCPGSGQEGMMPTHMRWARSAHPSPGIRVSQVYYSPLRGRVRPWLLSFGDSRVSVSVVIFLRVVVIEVRVVRFVLENCTGP